MVDRSSQNKQGAGRWQSRFNLSRLAISYPRLTIGFWIAVTVAGLISFGSLKYALFPDITFPVVLVSANGPTTTALATESQITTPIETSLKAVPDLVDVSSSSFSGQSVVRLSFATGSSLTQAEQDVKAAIAQADLPNDVETGVTPFNLNEASIISYAVVSDGPSRQVIYDRLQTGVVPDLEVVPGVLRVEVLGAADLETQQPSAADESAAAVGINLDSPTLVQFNGEDALAIRVIKDANANTLDVVQAIEAKVAELDIQGATLELAATQAQFIREATQSTIDALQLAIVLAVVIIYFFLWSFRATLITALAIPISLLGTCIVMALFNFNLETITLLALALVIGIVVDDAIVDVENIARHIEAGDPPREAALKATTEIGLTVSASTLTIVAVFLPIGLMHGTIGQFFKPFGLTVSAAVLISLLVARTLSPVLAVYWLRPKQNYRLETFHDSEFEATPAVSAAVGAGSEQRDFWANVTEWYKRFLSASLDHRNWVIVLAIAAFAAGIGLFPLVPKGFIPKLDRGSFNVIYTVDPSTLSQDVETAIADQIQAQLQGQAAGTGTTYTVQPGDTLDRIAAQTLGDPNLGPAIAQANQLQDPGALEVGQVLQIPPANLAQGGLPNDQAAAQEALANLPQPNEAEITRISLQQSEPDAKEIAAAVLTNTNVQSVLSVIGAQGAVNQGRLAVTLRDDRTEHTATVQDAVRQALPTIPNVAISVEDIQPVDTGSEKPLKVAFKGNNLNDLITTVQTVKQSIEQDPGFVDITATGDNEPETSPDADRKSIEHLNDQRVAYIRANLAQGQALGEATDKVVAEARKVMPAGVTIELGGDSERSSLVFNSFIQTLGLSVLCMFVVLWALFGRLLDPLVVLLSLPLSIVGAVLGLLLTRSDFGMIAVIGMIFLLGLLDKNAVLIVDYTNQLRQGGLTRQEALLVSGPVRLRPILMTTLSTILGMMPIALGWGAGAELRQPMAVAIIGGLLTSTLLSLIVVPVLYTLVDDVQNWLAKLPMLKKLLS